MSFLKISFYFGVTVINVLMIALVFTSFEILSGYLIRSGVRFNFINQDQQESQQVPSGKYGFAPLSPPARLEWADPETPIKYSKYQFSKGVFNYYKDLPFDLITKSGTCKRFRDENVLIYNISFEVDSFARRVVPQPDTQNSQNEYLIFLGCSFTFGDGLEDHQTLPYFAAKASPKHRSYNYGISGSSYGHALYRLKSITDQEISEKAGWVIYTSIDQHLDRLIGRMSLLGHGALPEGPYFELIDGQITTRGTFKSIQPVRTWLLGKLSNSNLVNFLNIDFPIRFSETDFRFASEIFKQMQIYSQDVLGAKGLIVIFYPGSRLNKELIPYLEESKIRYLDYSHWDISLLTEGPATIPYDGHPSEEANRLLGQSIVEQISSHHLFKSSPTQSE